MDDLKERSGNIRINSKLVSFIYELLRDHVLPSDIEALIKSSQEPDVSYTNGWLVKYAENVVNRLKD